MKKKYELIMVQSTISSYRLPYFKKISIKWPTLFLSSEISTSKGFEKSDLSELKHSTTRIYSLFGGKLNYQNGVLLNLIRYRPRMLYIGADARALTYWLSLILARIIGVKVYSHGQGAYRKSRPSPIDKVQYRIMVRLSERYICYTELSKNSLLSLGISSKKLRVADNSILNNFPLNRKQYDEFYKTKGILFLGRLREQVGLEYLLEVISRLNRKSVVCELHIIGGGEMEQELRSKGSNVAGVFFYGKVFNEERISEIAKKCIIGIHPGDAGLSIVHYMSLSLVPIVHSSMCNHMGPEPSYIKNNVNGLTFKYGSQEDLYRTLQEALADKDKLYSMAHAAYKTYNLLSNPDLGDKLINIMGEPC